MADFKLTHKAVQDLNRIWNYTFDKWSEKQADNYFGLLLETCHDIAKNPDSGKNYEGIAAGLLGQKVNRHIIFYRKPDPQFVEITRILHERMDLKSRITE